MPSKSATLRVTRKRPGVSPAVPQSQQAKPYLAVDEPELGGLPEAPGELLPDGGLLGDEAPPAAPEDDPLPDVVDELGELGLALGVLAAPGVPLVDGLDEEPEVPSVELFELPELLLLEDGVDEGAFAGALVLLPVDDPLVPLLLPPLSPQATRARVPSATLLIKNSFRMYSPPEPGSCA